MRIMLGAIAALGLAACSGGDETASDELATPTQNKLAANETPDYRYNPPMTAPNLEEIPPPLETSPRPQPLERTDPTAPPPASPPPPIPESLPGTP